MRLATYFVTNDEPAFKLYETIRVAPNGDGSTGRRRLQVITVVRKGKFADYTIDIGPATSMEPFVIAGGWQDPDTKRVYIEETVGRLRQTADEFRYKLDMEHYARETIPIRDIAAGYAMDQEIKETLRKHPGKTQIAT